jgi:hypothetical protein
MSQTVSLTSPLWGGGSGNLSSSNWIIGYNETITLGETLGFAGWIFGSIGTNENYVDFLPSITELGVTDTDVGIGGTLVGSLTTRDGVFFENNNGYVLTGDISSFGDILIGYTAGAGILTVSGTVASLEANEDVEVIGVAGNAPSLLTINSGGVVEATGVSISGSAAITVSGTGSSLDAYGLGPGFGILIGGGDGTNLTINDGATVEPRAKYWLALMAAMVRSMSAASDRI